jgi:hypothetical protein
MKKIVCGTLGAALLLLVGAGCLAQVQTEKAYWDTIGEEALFHETNSVQTAADRMHTHRLVVKQDARAIIEDVDFVLQRERPSRLSRWHNR